MNGLTCLGITTVPPELDGRWRLWLSTVYHAARTVPPTIRHAVAMLVTDKRFGQAQLFLTADALREAADEAAGGGERSLARGLRACADILPDHANSRTHGAPAWH